MRESELRDWYTLGQAATRLKVSRRHVTRLAQDGKLEAILVGESHLADGKAHWVFAPEGIEALKREWEDKASS